jgi:hypothetical protein
VGRRRRLSTARPYAHNHIVTTPPCGHLIFRLSLDLYDLRQPLEYSHLFTLLFNNTSKLRAWGDCVIAGALSRFFFCVLL